MIFSVSLSGAGDDQVPTFSSDVSNVRVDVQVTQDGQLVTDLAKSDFAVFDDGRRQAVVHFGRESEPLSLVLLLDVSGSTRDYLQQIASVAREALRYLRVRDRVAIMHFARDSRVRLDFTDEMSLVVDELKRADYDENLGAGTNINDALLAAARYIDKHTEDKGRRAVLIITDNLGLNYKSPDQPVIEALNDAETVLNAIVVGKGERPEPVPGGTYKNPDFTSPDVFRISEATGGEAVKADKAGKTFSTMIERIRTRYSLDYNMPQDAAKGFHRVEVKLAPEAAARYPRAQLRHRLGYRVR
jgi:VWFA-related protein